MSRRTWDWTAAERLDWRSPAIQAFLAQCAGLWVEEDAWRAVVQEIGLDLARLKEHRSPALRWHEAIQACFDRRLLRGLVERARQESGDPRSAAGDLLDGGVPVSTRIPLPTARPAVAILGGGTIATLTIAGALSWWIAGARQAPPPISTHQLSGRVSRVHNEAGRPIYTAVAEAPVVHADCKGATRTDAVGEFTLSLAEARCVDPPFEVRVLGDLGLSFHIDTPGFLRLDIPTTETAPLPSAIRASDVETPVSRPPPRTAHAYLVDTNGVTATHDGVLPPADLVRAVNPVLPAVGLVRAESGRPAGTAFLVAAHLVAMPRFLSDMLVRSRACVDFGGDGRSCSPLGALVYTHPALDVVLHEIEAPPAGARPLTLSRDAPTAGAPVALVGFPIEPTGSHDRRRVAAVYGGIFGVKRVLDGTYLGWSKVDLGTGGELGILQHDAVTAGGSAGSPVIDLATGLVVGVHFGAGNDIGFCVPTASLYGEVGLRRLPIRFSGGDGEATPTAVTAM